MQSPYIALLLMIIIAIVFSLVFINLSLLFAKNSPEKEKLSVYECGMPPCGDSRSRISVKFYMVAILFILFDIEAVFLFPWAVSLRSFLANSQGVFVLIEMFVFLGLLFLGWLYVVKRGAIKWD